MFLSNLVLEHEFSTVSERLRKAYESWKLFFALCLLVGCSPSALGQEIPAELLKQDRTEYYSILRQGKKSGWFKAVTSRADLEGTKAVRLHLQWQEVGLFFGRKQTSSMNYLSYYEAEPPYRLLRHRESYEQRGFKVEATLTPEGGAETGNYRIDIKEGEHNREAKVGDGEPLTLRDHWAPELVVMNEPKVGATSQARVLNTAEFKLDDITVKVLAKEDDGYQVGLEKKPLGRFITGAIRADGSWQDFVVASGDTFRRVETEEEAKKGLGEYSFEALWEVPVNKPLGEPELITEMVVSAKGNWSELLERNALQASSYNFLTGSTTIKVGKRYGRAEDVTPEDREKGLQATGPIPARHEKIREMAEQETKDAKDDWEKVERLFALVARSLDYQIDLDPLSVLEALKHKRGDCSEHSDLFAAFARSVGIPTRSVSGWVYMGDDSGGFAYHAWNEVAIDGKWVPLDVTWGELTPNATHIKMEFEEADLKFTRMFREGALAFRVKKVTAHGEARLKALNEVVSKYPGESAWLAARAGVFLALNKLEDAGKDLETATKLSPEIAEYYAMLSTVHEEAGRPEKAIGAQTKAAQLFPEHPGYWQQLGRICFEGERYEEAIAAIEEALKLQPGSAECLWKLGYLHYYADQSMKALEYLERALKIAANDADIHSIKGMVLEDLDRTKEAIQAYSRAIELSPDDGLNRKLRGECLVEIGDKAGAIKDLQQALKLGLDDEERSATKDLLKELQEIDEEGDR